MGTLILLMNGLPLIGSIVNGLVLRTRHTRRAGVIATLAAGGSLVIALMLTLELLRTGVAPSFTASWFSAGTTVVDWGFRFDPLTAVMALVVTGIGTLIHLYSIGYMSEEPTPSRYFAYLNLFLFSMLTLITADNLPVLFVGWEGVGLCSYLLIGYWYQDIEKANAGMKAFIVNRIGDAGFLLGIFLCYQLFSSSTFTTISQVMGKASGLNPVLLNLAGLCLFIGAMGKSAQIPLYIWLPDAMAGPTPVSALIHAATMVTAGVYLIVRMNFLFLVTVDTNLFIAAIGISTALLAAAIAFAQNDIKKVLAYSTVSQLGFMFLALGTKNYFAALFHVVTHAFFKALMFLGAGSVIHALEGEQDIMHMGGLRKKLPATHLTFAIGWIAICGLPPLAGFFSKDLILFGALSQEHGPVFWGLGLLASMMTAFYMTRLYVLTFWGEYRGHAHPHESPAVMTIPLWVLAFGSVTVGWLGMPHEFHLWPNYLREFLGPVLPAEMAEEHHTLVSENMAMILATGLSLVGVVIAMLVYGKGPKAVSAALRPIRALAANKFYVDELYGLIFIAPFRHISFFLARFFDIRIIDGAVLFPSRVVRAGATVLSLVQSGLAQFYLLVMLMGALVVLWLSLKGTVI
jgi:NADH-quinone oxidoreductase subunit L